MLPDEKMKHRSSRGFTLAEAAIVVVIVGFVLLAVLPTLKTFRQGFAQQATEQHLQSAARAIATFIHAHGCLPCPTPANFYGLGLDSAGFGRVRGETGAACGPCSLTTGVLPFASLGLPPSSARDGWGRWMTYAVDPALTTPTIVPPTSPCTATDISSAVLSCTITGAAQKGLCRTNVSQTNAPRVAQVNGPTQLTAFVLLSHGMNGRGSYTIDANNTSSTAQRITFPPDAWTCENEGYELCNADGDINYILAESRAFDLAPYDDLMIYYGRNQIISLLGPSTCATDWPTTP